MVSEKISTVGKIRRTLAHLSAAPFQSRWLDKAMLQALEKTLREAERGHRGEIRLYIERSLPFTASWRQSIRERAEDIFAHLRIWDTAERNGVLLYLNLTEHRLEIVADSGLNDLVRREEWQEIADETVAALYEKRHQEALDNLLLRTGDILRRHFADTRDPHGNELADEILLR